MDNLRPFLLILSLFCSQGLSASPSATQASTDELVTQVLKELYFDWMVAKDLRSLILKTVTQISPHTEKIISSCTDHEKPEVCFSDYLAGYVCHFLSDADSEPESCEMPALLSIVRERKERLRTLHLSENSPSFLEQSQHYQTHQIYYSHSQPFDLNEHLAKDLKPVSQRPLKASQYKLLLSAAKGLYQMGIFALHNTAMEQLDIRLSDDPCRQLEDCSIESMKSFREQMVSALSHRSEGLYLQINQAYFNSVMDAVDQQLSPARWLDYVCITCGVIGIFGVIWLLIR